MHKGHEECIFEQEATEETERKIWIDGLISVSSVPSCANLMLQPLCVERSWLINSFVSVGAEIIALGLQ